MVPVTIIDCNKKAKSCTNLKVSKLYIALKSETYISLRKTVVKVLFILI